ncbi:MAG: hypothetical protein M3463_12765 [Verrucomicrobiota bacterium]|nr:hypothetical protein [Verrucomicrobiota bacterium]
MNVRLAHEAVFQRLIPPDEKDCAANSEKTEDLGQRRHSFYLLLDSPLPAGWGRSIFFSSHIQESFRFAGVAADGLTGVGIGCRAAAGVVAVARVAGSSAGLPAAAVLLEENIPGAKRSACSLKG